MNAGSLAYFQAAQSASVALVGAPENGTATVDISELTKAEADYDRKLANTIVAEVQQKLGRGVFATNPSRAEHVRQLVAAQLSPTNAHEPPVPSVDTIIKERVAQGIRFLNTPSQYNSIIGRQRRRFLLQILADDQEGLLGDPESSAAERALIAKELHINLKTFDKYANELMEFGLGWQPTLQPRSSTAQEWIEVNVSQSSSRCPRLLVLLSIACVRFCPFLSRLCFIFLVPVHSFRQGLHFCFLQSFQYCFLSSISYRIMMSASFCSSRVVYSAHFSAFFWTVFIPCAGNPFILAEGC